MRGQFLHNQILLKPIERLAQKSGAKVQAERYLETPEVAGFIDLSIEKGSVRVACEAETTTDRIPRDIQKAVAFGADFLLIVVPTRRIAVASQGRVRRFQKEWGKQNVRIYVCTLPQAIQALRELMSFNDTPECPEDIKTLNPNRTVCPETLKERR